MDTENLQAKTQEILIKSKKPKEKKVFCETLVYQPENIEEMRLGSLFILGRLKNSPEATHIITLLTSTIKREYYLDPKRKPLQALDASFKRVNITLADLAKNGDFDWLNKIDFACAVLAKNYLHLTTIGRAKILLLREGSLTDIGKKLIPATEKVHPQKIFQSIASGKLFLNDKIILSTGDLFGYIPQKGLKQIIEQGQINQLEKILNEEKSVSSQGIIIIEAIPAEKRIKLVQTLTLSPSPSPSLVFPEDNRSNYFKETSRGVWSEIKFVSVNLLFKSKEILRLGYHSSLASLKTMLSRGEKEKSSLPTKQASQLGQPQQKEETSKIKILSTKGIKAAAFNPEHSIPLGAKLKVRFDEIKFFFSDWLHKLSGKRHHAQTKKKPAFNWQKSKLLGNKKIMTTFLVVAILLSFGIRYYYNQKYQKQIALYNSEANQTKEKLKKIQKIDSLSNLVTLIDFANSGKNFSPKFIFTEENGLLLLDATNNSLTQLPFENTANANPVTANLPNDKNLVKANLLNTEIIILSDASQKFYQYSIPGKNLSDFTLKFPFANAKIQDWAIYNNSLYLLDSQNGQIIKCSASKLANTNLVMPGACQSWLKKPADFSRAMAIGIDGSIYILDSNNNIRKYFNGQEKETLTIKIKPDIPSESEIETTKDFKNIYLISKKDNRLVIINKSGELLQQYAVPGAAISGARVANDESSIFVASGQKIFKITVQ